MIHAKIALVHSRFRPVILWSTAVVMVALTSSCTGISEIQPPSTPTTSVSHVGAFEENLGVLAWPGYAQEAWIAPFTEMTGCVVNVSVAGDVEQIAQALESGTIDVISGPGTVLSVAADDGLIQPINVELLPNVTAGLTETPDPALRIEDEAALYALPIGLNVNVLQYDAKVHSESPTSWSSVWESNGKDTEKTRDVTAYDSPMYIADAALYLMATKPDLNIKNPYALDSDQLKAAVDLLEAQSNHVSHYWTAGTNAEIFTRGDASIGVSWEALRTAADDPRFQTVVPEEGATVRADYWALTTTSQNPNCAYAWLNYVSDPAVTEQITAKSGLVPFDAVTCQISESDQEYCEIITTSANTDDTGPTLWPWTLPTQKCLDGREDHCTTYGDWSLAWSRMKDSEKPSE